jgi:hypothetical protein
MWNEPATKMHQGHLSWTRNRRIDVFYEMQGSFPDHRRERKSIYLDRLKKVHNENIFSPSNIAKASSDSDSEEIPELTMEELLNDVEGEKYA